jgi:hypothetical protein
LSLGLFMPPPGILPLEPPVPVLPGERLVSEPLDPGLGVPLLDEPGVVDEPVPLGLLVDGPMPPDVEPLVPELGLPVAPPAVESLPVPADVPADVLPVPACATVTG